VFISFDTIRSIFISCCKSQQILNLKTTSPIILGIKIILFLLRSRSEQIIKDKYNNNQS